MKTFREWLEGELKKQDWKPADLAHRSGVSRASVSNVLNDMRNPGPDFCNAIARALRIPPEKVFRAAGLLPALSGSEDDIKIGELLDIVKQLNQAERQDVLDYALWRFQRKQ
ncbi:MAG TPA: helix-turn-helix transcriptional regulator [Chloroflexi bacterium]|nr:helix-turn-helix transcriptional regulator [Chloroflexota bacterium]